MTLEILPDGVLAATSLSFPATFPTIFSPGLALFFFIALKIIDLYTSVQVGYVLCAGA